MARCERLSHEAQAQQPHTNRHRGGDTSPTIHIVIGQSGAGKTTFVKRNFSTERQWEVKETYPVAVSFQGGIAFIGRYGVGERTEGTDTLPYDSLTRILETIDKLAAEGAVETIVCEGDRINNTRFFESVLKKGHRCRLWLVEAPIETSMARLERAGSTITERFVKATRTKSRNNFRKYRVFTNGTIVRGG